MPTFILPWEKLRDLLQVCWMCMALSLGITADEDDKREPNHCDFAS